MLSAARSSVTVDAVVSKLRNMARQIAVAGAGARSWVSAAIVDAVGTVAPISDATGLVYANPYDADSLAKLLAENPHIDWVQLPFAGIEPFAGLINDGRTWTCGKEIYAEPVAEHALALALAGMRHLHAYARADSWGRGVGRNLLGANVTILGGGGIAKSLIRLLGPFNCDITVVRKTVVEMDGVSTVVESDRLHDALPGADLVVLALPLTAETVGIIGVEELALMEPHTWIVNVARGRHIVTDDLVNALESGIIGGAALDVTDPEPLPSDHTLWSMSNCIITPHTANTPEMAVPLLTQRIAENATRYMNGEPLVGLVDPRLGY